MRNKNFLEALEEGEHPSLGGSVRKMEELGEVPDGCARIATELDQINERFLFAVEEVGRRLERLADAQEEVDGVDVKVRRNDSFFSHFKPVRLKRKIAGAKKLC